MRNGFGVSAGAEGALQFCRERLLDDKWCSAHQDIAYYFKAPRAFLEAGRLEDAKVAFARLTPYLSDGAFNSANPVYAQLYPHYPWMWGAHSARRLREMDYASECDSALRAWQHPDGTGVVPGGEADLFATSMALFNHLTFGRTDEAVRSGDVLLGAIARNREPVLGSSVPSTRFQLRWDAKTLEFKTPPREGFPPALFYAVDQTSPGQLYFMLGFPVMVLHELSQATGDGKYLRVAHEVLQFLRGCHDDVNYSIPAHKVAMAASALGDLAWADRICTGLISQQFEHGGFMEDADALDTMDQTAELACWLHILAHPLDADVATAIV